MSNLYLILWCRLICLKSLAFSSFKYVFRKNAPERFHKKWRIWFTKQRILRISRACTNGFRRWFFRDGGPYHIDHIDTSLLICSTNQWTGFYMIGTSSVMKELIVNLFQVNVHSFYPLKTRKTLVFSCFQGVWNNNIGLLGFLDPNLMFD